VLKSLSADSLAHAFPAISLHDMHESLHVHMHVWLVCGSEDFPQVRRAPGIISVVYLLEIRAKSTKSKPQTYLHFHPLKTLNLPGSPRDITT
jgi:hypothetical protein